MSRVTTVRRQRSPTHLGSLLCLGIAALFGYLSAAAPPTASGRSGDGSRHTSLTAELDCSACHTPRGFRGLSQDADGSGFDHDRTGFPLRARHKQTACTRCHVPGQQIGRECNLCHQDAHQGRLSTDCSECHSAAGFLRTSAIERHRMTRLPLSGMHALTDCKDCHRRGGEREFAPVSAECFACHADDYRRSDVHPPHAGSADGSSPPFKRDCAQCHRASGWSPALLPVEALPLALAQSKAQRHDHELSFPLRVGPHRGAPCGSCHASENGSGPLRCIGCHAHRPSRLRTDHRGTAPPQAGRTCLGCHPGGSAR